MLTSEICSPNLINVMHFNFVLIMISENSISVLCYTHHVGDNFSCFWELKKKNVWWLNKFINAWVGTAYANNYWKTENIWLSFYLVFKIKGICPALWIDTSTEDIWIKIDVRRGRFGATYKFSAWEFYKSHSLCCLGAGGTTSPPPPF